ncbi:MAG: porin [Acidobacteriia bacterium]|nr:porin [Terriglobia bacterium]
MLMFVGPFALVAQTPNSADMTETIKALLARIDRLEKRVADLEGTAAPAHVEAPAVTASIAQPTTPSPQPPPGSHDDHLAATEAAQGTPQSPLLKLSGFSDIDFSATDQHGTKSGFNEGQFTLHMASALAPKVTVFSEFTMTARTDAGTGSPPAAGFNAEVERIVIRYDQSDYFKVSFGRFHTPINWWNTAFHHGAWLQTTAARPEMVQFGGRFIPVHFVGGLIEGAVPAGGLHLNYNVAVGNGRGSIISRAGDAGDINNNRAWLVNLFVKPDRLFGLQAGASLYRDKIGVGSRNFDEWISSGHLVWAKENPEFIAEFANVNHTETGRLGSFNSQAYYVQFGYRLPEFGQRWKPYYRWEYIHIPSSDPVFIGVQDLAGSTLGMRYDISTFSAFKLEYRNQRRPGLPRINGIFAQTSFTF